MSKRRPFTVEPEMLRDHGSRALVERVWRRLEPDLAPPRLQRRWTSLGWLPAVAAALIIGFIAGRQSHDAEVRSAGLVAEPVRPAEPASAVERRLPTASPAPERQRDVRPQRVGRRGGLTPSELEPPQAVPVEVVEAPVAVAAPAQEVIPEWVKFADRGEYERAYAALTELGGFDVMVGQASAEQLMILVDIARANGQRARAISALRSVVGLYADDPNAPVAAMMLGKMLMRAGDQRGAAEAFALYGRLSPEGDFAQDALARGFDAALEQGDLERARQVAKQYENDFPDGARLSEMRDALTQAEAEHAAAAAEAADADEEGEETEAEVAEDGAGDEPAL